MARRKATSPASREDQIISLAVDLAEKQLAEGTASAQVLTHYLKLAASRDKDRIEQQIAEKQLALMDAKISALQTSKNIEVLYQDAIRAMKSYQGEPVPEEELDEDIF